MYPVLTSVRLAALLAVAGGSSPGATRLEMDAALIQGEWELVSAHDDGQARGTDRNRVRVEGAQWRSADDVFQYRLRPLCRPRQIDWIFEGRVWRGIYEVSLERLRLCLAPPGQPRPTEFLTVRGDGRHLHVRRRVASPPAKGP